jgi:hypothetical protein
MKIMKTILVFLSFFIMKYSADAQDVSKQGFRVGITGGLGQYVQSDLKDINMMVKNQLSFKTNMINNFPLNVFWGIHFSYKLTPLIYAGLGYQYHTTGSRFGASDYSGTYTFDQIISCHSVYFQMEGTVYRVKETEFSANLSGGVQISSWNTTEKLVLQDQSLTLYENYKGLRPFIYPSFSILYPLAEFLYISPSAGYSFDIGGKYKNADHTDTDLKARWSGFRIEFSIYYSF